MDDVALRFLAAAMRAGDAGNVIGLDIDALLSALNLHNAYHAAENARIVGLKVEWTAATTVAERVQVIAKTIRLV